MTNNFTGYIGNRFGGRPPGASALQPPSQHHLVNPSAPAKDQMTSQIAASLGLCPIKDYKQMDLAGVQASPQGLLKPAPIRPQQHYQGTLQQQQQPNPYSMQEPPRDPWVYSNGPNQTNPMYHSSSQQPINDNFPNQSYPQQMYNAGQGQLSNQTAFVPTAAGVSAGQSSLMPNQRPGHMQPNYVGQSNSMSMNQGYQMPQQNTANMNPRNRMDGYYVQPAGSSYPNVMNPGLVNQGSTQPASSNQSWASLESDADLRFRRSKELFEQAQRTHQQIRNTQQEQLRLQQQQQQQQMMYAQSQSQINTQPAQPSMNKFYDSSLSYVNPSMQAPVSRMAQNAAAPVPNETLPNYYKSQGMSNKQAMFRNQKSRSFDVEDLSFHNSGAGFMPANSFQPIPSGQQQTNSFPIATPPLDMSQQPLSASQRPDIVNSSSFSLPVDVAYKLHSSHARHDLPRDLYDSTANPNMMNMHDLHASHAHVTDYGRNKSVSFNIPGQRQFGSSVYGEATDDLMKVSQMFPNCIECQKAEENQLLYRQALRLKKNNSDKTLNEYMKMGDGRYPTSVEDDRLKDLAQLISKTFSERLFQEERGDMRYPPGSARAQAAAAAAARKTDDYLPPVHYNSAGQKIPYRRLPSDSGYYDEDYLGEQPRFGGGGGGGGGGVRTPAAAASSRSRRTSNRGGGGGIIDYDSVPAYKDSTQYLALEGMSMRNPRGGVPRGNSRSSRDYGSSGGDRGLVGGGGGGSSSGRHSAYASDMDSYLYDRERYGSVNLNKLDTLSPHGGDPNRGRRNLKDIRYSRDYEFVPKSDDLYNPNGGRRRAPTTASSDRGHSPMEDPRYPSDAHHRRSSPRSRHDDYGPSGGSLKPHSSHRRVRSSSVRDDLESGPYRDQEVYDAPSRSSGRHGVKSRHSQGTNNYSYNFAEGRDQRRRGSSSESIDRLSSPDRSGGGGGGHHRRAAHYDDKHSSRHRSHRGEDGHGGGGGRPRDPQPGPSGPPHGKDGGGGGMHPTVNGMDPNRQKLSEVPPNHSTESGYSSQSQHTAGSRDDRGLHRPGRHPHPAAVGGDQSREAAAANGGSHLQDIPPPPRPKDR